MEQQEKLKRALLKKALGYTADEIVCEYVLDEDGQQRLAKKKITKKHIAPDIAAARVLLESFDSSPDYASMSDEQLLQEKQRLLQLLKDQE